MRMTRVNSQLYSQNISYELTALFPKYFDIVMYNKNLLGSYWKNKLDL